MKDIILKKAIEYYDFNLATINYEKIPSLKIVKDRSYFYFSKKENIAIDNYKENIRYILGLHSINFQYWDVTPQHGYLRYSNNGNIGAIASYEGYDKLYQSIILSNKKIDVINHEQMRNFFGNISNLHGRINILKESLNKVLFELAYEVLMNDVIKNNLIDTTTAQKIADILPKSYSDPFLKKIQLALFETYELLKFKYPTLNVDLTVAADYQIPKVLSHLGIITYNEDITNKILNRVLINEDSNEEMAIRASAIIACEEISNTHKLPTGYVDKYLWEQRNNTNLNFHLTKTTRY